MRAEFARAGHDAGPATIAHHLGRRLEAVPSPATVWRILRRHGLSAPSRTSGRGPRSSASRPPCRPLLRVRPRISWLRSRWVAVEEVVDGAVVEVVPIHEELGPSRWTDLAHALDLRAGLAVAEATLRGAIERRETRGAHNRTDFPDLAPAPQVNFYVDARMDPWSEPVPGVPDELREWTERPVELGAERLLE